MSNLFIEFLVFFLFRFDCVYFNINLLSSISFASTLSFPLSMKSFEEQTFKILMKSKAVFLILLGIPPLNLSLKCPLYIPITTLLFVAALIPFLHDHHVLLSLCFHILPSIIATVLNPTTLKNIVQILILPCLRIFQ